MIDNFGATEYKTKVVEFDSETQVKQATLREILWDDFKEHSKPYIYESNVIEIFGESEEKIKQAFLNNGIKFYDPNLKSKVKENIKLDPERIVEIGSAQLFEFSQFITSEDIEEMMRNYGYKLDEVIERNGAILIIHNGVELQKKFPLLYAGLLEKIIYSDNLLFLFLSVGQTLQFLPQINLAGHEISSYEYVLKLWQSWEVDTTCLKRLYQALLYNIMI